MQVAVTGLLRNAVNGAASIEIEAATIVLAECASP